MTQKRLHLPVRSGERRHVDTLTGVVTSDSSFDSPPSIAPSNQLSTSISEPLHQSLPRPYVWDHFGFGLSSLQKKVLIELFPGRPTGELKNCKCVPKPGAYRKGAPI